MTPETKTMTFRGRPFVVQKGTTHPEYSYFCFEDDEADFRDKYWHPEAGQVVVDVGASYGAYSLTALAMGAKVIAFEPEESVFCDLQANCALNGWLNGEVVVWSKGLWDCNESVDMKSYAPHWPAQTITAPFKMTSLDSYNLPKVDWLKVDVEGAEVRVLRGGTETIKRCKPVVIVESHVFLDPTLTAQCRAILEECGYSEFEVVEREPCEMLIARS